jgi:putative ABC transport system permease protein
VHTYLLNETAVQNLNLENPVGAEINWYRDGFTEKGRVIGVVKDFHFQSLHEPLRPMLFAIGDNFNFIVIRGSFSNLNEDIAAIEKVYRTFDQTFEFEFSFLDDQLQKQYQGEKRLGSAIAIFSVIAVAIACAGLFGMALILFNRKIKEISIRKVLGATTIDLLIRLLRSYTILVLVAGLVAAPLTWWTMNKWLANFNYRIEVSAVVFIAAIALLLCVSWITLSYLTLKTARLNPADTLKSE